MDGRSREEHVGLTRRFSWVNIYKHLVDTVVARSVRGGV
jgi:hypothetical protein